MSHEVSVQKAQFIAESDALPTPKDDIDNTTLFSELVAPALEEALNRWMTRKGYAQDMELVIDSLSVSIHDIKKVNQADLVDYLFEKVSFALHDNPPVVRHVDVSATDALLHYLQYGYWKPLYSMRSLDAFWSRCKQNSVVIHDVLDRLSSRHSTSDMWLRLVLGMPTSCMREWLKESMGGQTPDELQRAIEDHPRFDKNAKRMLSALVLYFRTTQNTRVMQSLTRFLQGPDARGKWGEHQAQGFYQALLLCEAQLLERDWQFMDALHRAYPSEQLLWKDAEQDESQNAVFVHKNAEQTDITPNDERDSLGTQFISDAGLIILAPYLPQFFEGTNLLLDKAFVNKEAKLKGLTMLQYLAFSKPQLNEELHGLSRYLLDWPHTQTMLPCVLNAHEMGLCNELLSSVIKHWQALGNTSVRALQESFIARPAKLVQNDSVIELFIEKRGVDILLDQLPWTISQVSLPWLNRRIMAHWR